MGRGICVSWMGEISRYPDIGLIHILYSLFGKTASIQKYYYFPEMNSSWVHLMLSVDVWCFLTAKNHISLFLVFLPIKYFYIIPWFELNMVTGFKKLFNDYLICFRNNSLSSTISITKNCLSVQFQVYFWVIQLPIILTIKDAKNHIKFSK